MSDVVKDPATTQVESPSTPPSGAAGAAPTPPEPYRFGESAPSWAKGKTAEEILGLVELQNQTIQQLSAQPQATPQREQPRAENGQFAAEVKDDDFLTGAHYRMLAQQLQTRQQPINDALQSVLNTQASTARMLAETRSDRDNRRVFQKYGPEIDAELAKIPAHMKTLDNIQHVVDVVSGRHVHDLARDLANEMAAQTSPTMRSLGGAGSVMIPQHQSGPALPLEDERIPQDVRTKWREAGLTNDSILEFGRSQGYTVEDFYKLYGKTPIGGGK